MCEPHQIRLPAIGHPEPIQPSRITICPLDESRDIRMRQMVNANPACQRNGRDVVRFDNRPAMHGRRELDRPPAEQPRMRLRPITGLFVMHAQDVVSQRNRVDRGLRTIQPIPQIRTGFRRQHLVVVQEQDPLVAAQRQRECPRFLHRRRPRHDFHPVGEPRRHLRRSIGRGLVHHDHLVREGHSPQTRFQQPRAIMADNKGAKFFPHGDPVPKPPELYTAQVNNSLPADPLSQQIPPQPWQILTKKMSRGAADPVEIPCRLRQHRPRMR